MRNYNRRARQNFQKLRFLLENKVAAGLLRIGNLPKMIVLAASLSSSHAGDALATDDILSSTTKCFLRDRVLTLFRHQPVPLYRPVELTALTSSS